MASSQVEVPSSFQRFGFILRDRNQKTVVLQKNLNPLLKDHNHHHHHPQLFKSHVSDENSANFVDSWIETRTKKSNRIRPSRVFASPVETVARKEKTEESKRKDNLGASSLVQIWEARLNRSNGGNSLSHNELTASSSGSDSEVSVQDSELTDESEMAEAKNADPTVEIESGSDGSVSDSGESKWGRVADLIRRLSDDEKLTTGNDVGCGLSIIQTPRPCISSFSSSVKTNFPVVNFSPRIRGRQAFTDLIMQMERERHRELDSLLERNAVSKFTQRGRIQSMLKLRNLKRCLAIQDRSRSNAITTGFNRIESVSAVRLRDKFRANAVNTVAAADQRNDHHQFAQTNKETKVTTEQLSTRLKKGSVTLEAFFAERLSLCNRKIEKATSCKKEETANTTVESKLNCLPLRETTDVEESCNDDESEEEQEEKTSQNACVTREFQLGLNQSENNLENCMQETQTQGLVHESDEMAQYLQHQETSFMDGWEEPEEYEDEESNYGETNNEWLSEISRPKSYWEELRKSRYLEVMNTRSEKEDIRRLLERRTVTDFLESGLREQIDRLMMSRVQTHSHKPSDKWELQQEEQEMSLTEGKKEIEEEEPLTEGEDQGDRYDSSRSSCSQMFASSPAGSWTSQDSEVTSTPIFSVQDPQYSPETEMLSCMRSQIQQLQQEMSVLRDAVKTCLDANASLQQLVHRETPVMKRKCCACNETQVEAILYRCGHMCMCLKCANELHWSGGKCPICGAQIVDVVRVFVDTRN